MGKSLGNAIILNDIFYGNNFLFDNFYDPMSVRFFILQNHYRSPLDFSLKALTSSLVTFPSAFDNFAESIIILKVKICCFCCCEN